MSSTDRIHHEHCRCPKLDLFYALKSAISNCFISLSRRILCQFSHAWHSDRVRMCEVRYWIEVRVYQRWRVYHSFDHYRFGQPSWVRWVGTAKCLVPRRIIHRTTEFLSAPKGITDCRLNQITVSACLKDPKRMTRRGIQKLSLCSKDFPGFVFTKDAEWKPSRRKTKAGPPNPFVVASLYRHLHTRDCCQCQWSEKKTQFFDSASTNVNTC